MFGGTAPDAELLPVGVTPSLSDTRSGCLRRLCSRSLVLLDGPHVPIRIFEEAVARAGRAFGPHLLYLAYAYAPPGEFAAEGIEILDDELDSLDRAGLAKRQALADHHGAGRAGRRHLHHPHALAGPYIVVESEADLPGVEILRGVDIAHRNGNYFELHVHGGPSCVPGGAVPTRVPAARNWPLAGGGGPPAAGPGPPRQAEPMGALRPVRPGRGYQPVPGPDPFGDMTAGPRKPPSAGMVRSWASSWRCRAGASRSCRGGRWRRASRSSGLGRRSFGQPLVGAVPAGEPPGGEGCWAFGCRGGAGFDGRERDAFAGDEGELRGARGVVVGDDFLVAPGHHVLGPPVQEAGGVDDEEPRLEFLGLGGEQCHRVSGLRLGGVLGGRQPREFQGVPLVVAGDHAVVGARDFGGHCGVPFGDRGRVR